MSSSSYFRMQNASTSERDSKVFKIVLITVITVSCIVIIMAISSHSTTEEEIIRENIEQRKSANYNVIHHNNTRNHTDQGIENETFDEKGKEDYSCDSECDEEEDDCDYEDCDSCDCDKLGNGSFLGNSNNHSEVGSDSWEGGDRDSGGGSYASGGGGGCDSGCGGCDWGGGDSGWGGDDSGWGGYDGGGGCDGGE